MSTHLPAANIHHSSPGRLRLKIFSRKNVQSWFTEAEQTLHKKPGVSLVRGNHVTASLLITYDPTTSEAELLEFCREQKLCDLSNTSTAVETVAESIERLFAQGQTRLLDVSHEHLDLRSLSLMGLVSLAMLQLARGRTLPPALNLIWSAMQLLNVPEIRHSSDKPISTPEDS